MLAHWDRPYIARPPLSLKKMLVEAHGGSVLYRSEYNPYFKTNQKLFPVIEFVVDLLQHLPDAGAPLIPDLYSSRSRGTWSRKPHLLRLAPEGWKEQQVLAVRTPTSARPTSRSRTCPSPKRRPAPPGPD
jgi:hypothetical protein